MVVNFNESLTPGQAITVADPHGCHFRCTVPNGLKVGENFHVKVPLVVPRAADPTGGRGRGLRFLQLQLAGADADARIVLAAVEYGADAATPHLMVQLFLSDRSSLGPVRAHTNHALGLLLVTRPVCAGAVCCRRRRSSRASRRASSSPCCPRARGWPCAPRRAPRVCPPA